MGNDSDETYIVQIAERIDVEHVCETGCQAKILEEAGEHMPGIALK